MCHFVIRLFFSVSLFAFIQSPVLATVQLAPLQQGQTLANIAEQSPKELAQQLGRKLTLKERIGLRVLRRQLRNYPEMGEQDWRTMGADFEQITQASSDPCDYIFLLDGTKMAVTIGYLSETEVHYVLCDPDEKENYTLPLSEVLYARDHRNVGLYRTRGREKRRFLKEEILPNEPRERTDKLGIFALLSSLAGLGLIWLFWPIAIVGAIVGFVLAKKSYRRYEYTSYTYDGKDAATIAMIVSIGVGLLFGLVALLNSISIS